MTENFDKLMSIFQEAVEMHSPESRDAFVRQAAGEEEGLYRRVCELLESHEHSGSLLNEPAVAVLPTLDHAITERPGTVIGPYKLMEQIGEGGFGLVFVAEQTRPVRRKVALKIIKPGMDTREVLARFSAEQQALALMDHPNIARVFDAGTTETGRPYFVMELVKGVSIVEYCRHQKLTVQERLELFVTVCQAIQHAHTKGVIHRDLKPSNVMVAPHDGVPVIKVIDFGVAKAIGQQLTERTIYTSYAQMIGTPLYMSPEQAEINALDVDIRSDVYSLGVLLYELLTGTTPLDRGRITSATYDEIRRIIKEEDPPKPSTRLSTLGELLTTVSTERKIEPTKLSKLIRGELDWIVMKALEKERKRRYQTAKELAEDVQRHLDHELVEARPPSLLYKMRKFVRRNRAAVGIAATVFLALAITSVGMSIGFVTAQAGWEEADARRKEVEISKADSDEKAEKLAVANQRLREKETGLLLQTAYFLISERETGYKLRAFEIITELKDRDLTPAQREQLRDLAVACLGDPSASPSSVLDDFDGRVYRAEMNPSGTWLAVSLLNGESFLHEVANGKRTRLTPRREPNEERISIFDFINDDLLVLTQLNSEVQIWIRDDQRGWRRDEHRFDVKDETGVKTRVGGVATTPDGKWMVLSRVRDNPLSQRGADSENLLGEKKVYLYDISDRAAPRLERTLTFPEDLKAKNKWGAMTLDIDPAGRFAAGGYRLGDKYGSYTIVWNLKTGASSYVESGRITRFSRDGRWLAVTKEGSVEVYDVEHLDEFPHRSPNFYQRSDFVVSTDFTDSGRTLLLPGYQTYRVKVWSISENQEIASLFHPGVIFATAADDGRVVATVSADTIRLWKLNELPERTRLLGHEGGTTGMDYSPDGRYLATVGKDRHVRIWDSVSGKLIRELDLDDGEFGQMVDFSDNGRWLAVGSGGPSSRVWIWDAKTGELRAKFDSQLGRKTWSVHFCDSDRKLAVSGHSGLRLLKLTSEPEFSIQPIFEETLLTSSTVTRLVSDDQTLYWLQDEKDDDVERPGDGLYSHSFADAPTKKGKLIEAFDPTLLGLDLHPQDGLYYSSQDHARIRRRSPGGQELQTKIACSARYLTVHSHKPWAALAQHRDLGGFEIRNRDSGKRILKFPARGTIVWYLACHPERNQLAVARSGGIVELWNLDQVEVELAKLGL